MYTLVASHDAGGAETLSSWIKNKKFKKNKLIYYLKGPALNIFKKKISNIKNVTIKKINNLKISKILTTTSWDSNLEKKIIIFGKENKIKTYSFLDHWNNYTERFTYNNKIILPDKIFVADSYALRIAKKKFKKIPIQLIKNYYKIDLLKKIKFKKVHDIKKILYISEPIENHGKKHYNNPMHWGYNEYSLLNYFFLSITRIVNERFVVIFRKHPSEKIYKYKNILKKYSKKIKIIISKNNELFDDLNLSDIVVGNQSMAIVMGLHAGKKVFSTLPKKSIKILPYKKIIYLDK